MLPNRPHELPTVRQFVLILSLLFPSLAQAERLPLKTYTTADGLAHNEINKIVRDSRGFLWFCLADGLSRFDGYEFTNYGTAQGLPHPYVTDFLETRAGDFWVATMGGLVRFNPKGIPAKNPVYENGRSLPGPMFTTILPDDDDRHAKAVTMLLEDPNGTIWCGTYKGLFRMDRRDNRFSVQPVDIGIPSQYPEQLLISDLLPDAYGSLWIATASGLYRRWSDGSAARYTKRDGLPDDYVHDLMKDHLGRMWAGTRSGGFFLFTADDSHRRPVIAHSYKALDGLTTNWIFQLFETSEHHFWVATNKGLVEFFPEASDSTQRFRAYTPRNGLSYHEITAMNEDLGGNIWLGTNQTGAMKLAHNGFITYDEQDGLANTEGIFEDREGGVCFRGYVLGDARASVFDGGKLDLLNLSQASYWQRFGRFDGQRFTWFMPASPDHSQLGWVGEHVTLQTRNGESWLGTANGVYRFPAANNFTAIKTARPLNHFTEKDGLAAPQVFYLFEDSRGDVWISTISSTGNGLARWQRNGEILDDISHTPGLPSLKDNLPRSLAEDRAGDVWVGFSEGLARFHGSNLAFFSERDGLAPGVVKEIYSDGVGRLWLASSSAGLIRVDNPEAEHPVFVHYSTAEGLSSNDAEVITDDLYGRIYVGTGRGVDRLDPAIGRIKHFTTADGLAPGEFKAAFRDPSGALWFGTARGLSRFVPEREETTAPPPILISGLLVAGSAKPVSALGETEISIPDLTANQNELQINFVGLSFAPGEVLRYQYKLEGADADWSAPSEQRTVNFANLAPRNYKFLVRAVNSDGVISRQPAAISLRILPPLWQRWWFLVLLALLGIAIVYISYRYRVARLLEVATMRTRIATDLHDDIGANLTRIAILSEVAKQQFGNRDESKTNPLSSIAEIARESVGSMSDIVWAIDPERDTLHDLTRKMRQHADEVFTLRDIELDFRAPAPEQNLKLGVDVRRDLLLIFKEAVNNAARHATCSHVLVDFRADNSSLHLEVADNGVGFDASIGSEGQGLISMRRRTQRLGGVLEIETRAGEGTSIRASIPLVRD